MLFRHNNVMALGTVLFGALLLSFSPSVLGQSSTPAAVETPVSWTASSAKHVYGFPDTKAGKQGVLVLSDNALVFRTKAKQSAIPRTSIVAVSNGTDRVEMWGVTGQLLRMAIPDGGGIAASAVLHHRIGMFTVDFVDARGGKHSAVFDMTPDLAAAGLAKFSESKLSPQPTSMRESCAHLPSTPGSVMVEAPNWEAAEVPAAYRSLVYERMISRLQKVKGVTHVYRDGEAPLDEACPAYKIKISVKAFKQGNQVARASLGPIGMFVGTTVMLFDFNLTDASGKLNENAQIKAANRTQSENTDVADIFAKRLAKHYLSSLKKEETAAERTGHVERINFD